MAYLNAIIKTIKQIHDSDKATRDRYNYYRNSGLSLHMIKKAMGAEQNQWKYINNALRSGVDKGKIIKTGGKYRVVVIKKKSRKLRKCKYGRDRRTGKCRKKSKSPKRRSRKPRRKASRKRSRKKNKFRMKRRRDPDKPTREKKTRTMSYGACRIPLFDKKRPPDDRTHMILPFDSNKRTETCAQYIIHAHGCSSKLVFKTRINSEIMNNINVITYAPMGQLLKESCARQWHNYLVRRRPQFDAGVGKPPQDEVCRPYRNYSAYTPPPKEIIISGDSGGQFHSGVLDITDCCNRPHQRGPDINIQAPIVMSLESKSYRLSTILKRIKDYNRLHYNSHLTNIFVHLLTCLGDDVCTGNDGCVKHCTCYELSGDQLAMYGHCQTCLNKQ